MDDFSDEGFDASFDEDSDGWPEEELDEDLLRFLREKADLFGVIDGPDACKHESTSPHEEIWVSYVNKFTQVRRRLFRACCLRSALVSIVSWMVDKKIFAVRISCAEGIWFDVLDLSFSDQTKRDILNPPWEG